LVDKLKLLQAAWMQSLASDWSKTLHGDWLISILICRRIRRYFFSEYLRY